MRERITFVHRADDAFRPEQFQLEHDVLHVEALKGAREDQLTFSLSELPQELWRVLKQCHELHLRWASAKPYSSIAPFVSRTSPGLHVSFSPHRNRTADLLCPLLHKVFGEQLKCASPEETFTGLPLRSERFATSAALQYHEVLPSLNGLVTYIQHKICARSDEPCADRANGLLSADYLDLDYDTISQSLIVTTFHSVSPAASGWDEQFPKPSRFVSLEVGVLSPQPATEPESLSLGGFLTKLGSDSKPKPTLFSFPSRHHPPPPSSNSTYRAFFLHPTGLHPTLRLSFPSPLPPPHPHCALHTHLTLPSPLFPDKYQLSLPTLLASKNLRRIHSLTGETDLEAPNWVIQKWGSSLLLELAPPSPSQKGPWNADVLLHLRYLPPAKGGFREVDVPWPVVFWACPAEEGTKMGTNPFDRGELGYDGIFGRRTLFVHLEPVPAVGRGLVETVRVPVIDAEKIRGVELGTVLVVLLGVAYVLGKLAVVVGRDWGLGSKGERRKRE